MAARQQESNTIHAQRVFREYRILLGEKVSATDLEFLRRVSQDVRGIAPTKVEENYFLADKDPKKREKLLELIAGKSKGSIRTRQTHR